MAENTTYNSTHTGQQIDTAVDKVLNDLKSVAFSGSYNDLDDKPFIPEVITGLKPVAFSADYMDLINRPAIGNAKITIINDATECGFFYLNSNSDKTIVLRQQQADWNETDPSFNGYILNKPVLANVATSGSYNDLSDTPNLANVAISGSYNDLSNCPTVGDQVTTITFNGVTKGIISSAGTGAQTIALAQVQPDWNQVLTDKPDFIQNKPTIGKATITFRFNGSDVDTLNANDTVDHTISFTQVQPDWNANVGYGAILNKPNFSTVATSGSYSDLNNKPFIPVALSDLSDDAAHRLVTDTEKTTWNNKQDVIGDLSSIRSGATLGATAVQPGSLATVATTGSYYDLATGINASDIQADWTETQTGSAHYIKNKPTLHTVATSGAYTDLSSRPSGYVKITKNMGSDPSAASQYIVMGQCDIDASGANNNVDITLHKAAFTGSYNDLEDLPGGSSTGVLSIRIEDATDDLDNTGGRVTIPKDLSSFGVKVSEATTATNLAAAPSFSTYSTNQIKVTAGGQTSAAFTVPYATEAGSVTALKYYDHTSNVSSPTTANLTVRKYKQSGLPSSRDANTLYLVVS